jgi:hypothetical protein
MNYFQLNDIKIRNPFKLLKKFYSQSLISNKNSPLNFFIQSINIFVTFLLITAILPVRIDEYLNHWESVKILYSYLPRIGISIILWFITWVITETFSIRWIFLLKTKLIHSFIIMICLFGFCVLLYLRALILLYNKYIKNIKIIQWIKV